MKIRNSRYTLRAGLIRAKARLEVRVKSYGTNGTNGGLDYSGDGSGVQEGGAAIHNPLPSGLDLSGFSVLVSGLPPDVTRNSSAQEMADAFSEFGVVVHVAIGVRELGKPRRTVCVCVCVRVCV